MPWSDGRRILEFEKKTVSWDLGSDEASRFSELAEARPVVCGGVPHVVGVKWKSQHRKKLCLSLLMLENLKLKKVNKSFIPEPKKRIVSVSCFSNSFVYEHLWMFSVSVWICLFQVILYWIFWCIYYSSPQSPHPQFFVHHRIPYIFTIIISNFYPGKRFPAVNFVCSLSHPIIFSCFPLFRLAPFSYRDHSDRFRFLVRKQSDCLVGWLVDWVFIALQPLLII